MTAAQFVVDARVILGYEKAIAKQLGFNGTSWVDVKLSIKAPATNSLTTVAPTEAPTTNSLTTAAPTEAPATNSLTTAAPTEAACVTIAGAELTEFDDGIGAGYTCDFPFMYDGAEYDTCTEVSDPGKPWCYVTGDKWGYCADIPSCKTNSLTTVAPTEAPTTNSLTTAAPTEAPATNSLTTAAPTEAACVTIAGAELTEFDDGIGAGYTCDFPFMYDGAEYDTCTEVSDPGKPWCYVTGDKWGYCADIPSCKTRRLASPKQRRLVDAIVLADYTITVPATDAAAATKAEMTLKTADTDAWQTAITASVSTETAETFTVKVASVDLAPTAPPVTPVPGGDVELDVASSALSQTTGLFVVAAVLAHVAC